jgi:signal transduction histidine kinase/CheY-like chemotaxis protein
MPLPAARPGHLLTALTAAAGVALTIGSFVAVRQAEYTSIRAKAQAIATDRVRTIQREADEALTRLFALRGFFRSSDDVTREEFDQFLAELMRPANPEITFVWWPALEFAGKGTPYVYLSGSGAPASADLWNRGDVQEGMREAQRSGGAVAVQGPGRQAPAAQRGQIVVLAAVYGPARRRGPALQGYVGVVLSAASLSERAIRYLAPGGIDVAIIDPAFSGPERILHFHPSRKGGPRTRPQDTPDFQFTETLNIAGRRLLVICHAAPRYVQAGYGKTSWIILVSGLLATAAGAWLLGDRIGYSVRVERLVERRTRQLAAARDAALQASKLKSQFLANVSHEIRTPLNGIVGASEVLLETALDPEQREFGATIRHSANALLVIVNDLLDMSRIEAGRLSLDAAAFDLREAASATLAGLSGSAREKGLSMKLEIHPEVPGRVFGDPVRLQQVLVNLLHNAIKFTAVGTVGLRIRLDQDHDTHHILRFEVQDTGPGLAPEALQVIFRRFAQADGTNSRRHGGLGLGLAISRQIVELMQGAIGVESQLGQGSTFWFTAVFQKCSSESPAERQATPVRVNGGEPAQLILLVEDNALNRRLAGRMLSKLGYPFHEAGNGREAVEAVERNRYAAILMDCQMPVMDGFEATARIRGSGGAEPPPPIIALTANAMQGDREACLAQGMDDYVAKPVQMASLSAVLERWVNRDRQSLPLAGGGTPALPRALGE